jgi:lactate dehydrogenase-like 2-hydroxyacid dehydrogenase
MKEKILITRPMFADVVEKLRQYFEVEINTGEKYTSAELQQALQNKAGVLLAGGEKVDESLVRGLPGLRAVCVAAVGYNNVDVHALTKAGIIATNAPGPADETVADFTWGLMIATARKLTEAGDWLRQGQWTASAGSRFFGTEVHGKTMGIIGMGRIGQAIARRAAGFSMQVLYYNRHRLEASIEQDCRAAYASKNDLLGRSDFVVLSLPYSKENHHTIAAAELALMKPTAMLFNIARGGLIDEVALAEALRDKKIAAAGLDVFEGEPAVYPGLLNLPNIVLTPHIAGATEAAQHGLADLGADNLIAALGYGPNKFHPPSILNPETLKQ